MVSLTSGCVVTDVLAGCGMGTASAIAPSQRSCSFENRMSANECNENECSNTTKRMKINVCALRSSSVVANTVASGFY